MIPDVHGTVAEFEPATRGMGPTYLVVTAWDESGYALVPGPGGRLRRAAEVKGFAGLYPATRDESGISGLRFGAAQ